MFRLSRSLFRRLATSLALAAVVSLLLHVTLHAASLASVGETSAHTAATHRHGPAAHAHNGDSVPTLHDHAAAGAVHQAPSSQVPNSDPDWCCCNGAACLIAVLPTVSAALPCAMLLRVATAIDGDQIHGAEPDRLRRPPRTSGIA